MSTTTVNGITEFSIDEPPAAQRRRSSSYVKHDSDSDEDGDGLRHLKRPKPSQKGRRKKNRRRQPPPRAIVKDPDEQDSREVEVDDGRVVGVMTGLDDHGDDYGPYGGSSVVMSVAALQNRLRHLNATALPYEGRLVDD
jgi:hypothetical protein